MAKKIKLDLSFEWNGILLAMVCTIPDYKLAWKLSRALSIEFCRENDWVIKYDSDKKNSFLLYQFKNEYTTFRLLKNKAYNVDQVDQAWLLPELKDFDYLLLIETEADIDFDAIKKQIQHLENVQLLKSFNPESLKSKHNIAF